MSAAYLDLPVAQEIFGNDPRAVLAWGPGPKARAIAVEGGYKVTGVYAFASGCRHATWLGAHAPIYNEDGSRMSRPGRPAGRAHPAGAVRRGRVDRHLGHGGPARHGLRPVRADRSLRARRPYDHARVREGMPRSGRRSTGWAPAPATRWASRAWPAASPAAPWTISSTSRATRCRAAPRARCATTRWCNPTSPRPRSTSAPRGPISCSRWPRSGRTCRRARRSRSSSASPFAVRRPTRSTRRARRSTRSTTPPARPRSSATIRWSAASATSTP